MWKTLTKLTAPVLRTEATFLTAEAIVHNQIRTTFILKRKVQPPLNKKGAFPKQLKSKHFIYELVKDTDIEKQQNMEVILTSYVEGVGKVGDKVSVKPNYAYNKLLLPGLAVYASPENIERYKAFPKHVEEEKHSSPIAQMTVNTLSRMTLSVIMNKENPWTLKPWHIKAAFRKCCIHVPEEAITMPVKEIKGPDMNIQNKEFYITVTINNLEKVNVRCRVHHWSTQVVDRIPHQHEFWKTPSESIFPEDVPVLANIPSMSTSNLKQSL